MGATQPFGVAKVGIDTTPDASGRNNNGGWTPSGNVTGISMLHVSGTAGAPKYGVIAQMPLTTVDGPVNVLVNSTYSQPRVGKDVAQVGYYKTSLLSGVDIELSATHHAGFLQYSFPAGEKHILVDVSHLLSEPTKNTQIYLDGKISVKSKQYTGYGTYRGGWNNGAPYTVYFCGEFDQHPESAKTFRAGSGSDPIYGNNATEEGGPQHERVGALFSWKSGPRARIRSKLGISFISAEKACKFKDNEISSWTLKDTIRRAVEEWNQDVFSKVQVDTGGSANRTNLRLLYSSLYFAHMMPSDRTGENPLWKSQEPYWDDFYAIWDTFRCTSSLWHLLQPHRLESMIRGLIDIWRFEGFMSDARSGNYNGYVQGGSNTDNMLADAYTKGLRGGINWADGYKAMVKDAESQPMPEDRWGWKEGRGALYDWIPLGYLSVDKTTRSLSRTVEYSANDYALSVVAAGESGPADVAKYRNRSAGWQNLWNDNVESQGFAGFLAPRLSSGEFNLTDYDPALCGRCSWDEITYEGTPWEYSFYVPHDMKSLVQFMGGARKFEERLDHIVSILLISPFIHNPDRNAVRP